MTHTVLKLFVAALIVRLALAAALQWVVPALPIGDQVRMADPLLAERTSDLGITVFWDEWMYEQLAWGIAQWWRSAPDLLASGAPLQWLLPNVYLNAVGQAWEIQAKEAGEYLLPHVYAVAALYTLIGHQPAAARALQSAVTALIPVLVFLLGRQWFGGGVARLAGWTAVFEPATVFWSPWVLKDGGSLVLILTVLLCAGRLARSPRVRSSVVLAVSLGLLTVTRAPVAIYLGLLTPLAALAARPNAAVRRWVVALSMLLLTSSVLWVSGEGFMGVRRLNPDLPFQLWYARTTFGAGARTALPEVGNPPAGSADPLRETNAYPRVPLEANLESTRRNLAQLPMATVAVLTAPTPWSAETPLDRLALLFMPSWYAVLSLAALGLAFSKGPQRVVLLLPLAYVAMTVLYLALIDTNVGMILRHRTLLLPVLLPLAAHGFLALGSIGLPFTRHVRHDKLTLPKQIS